MIPPYGYMSVLGQIWDTQGKIFKCRLKKAAEDTEGYLEGTVLFLHKVVLAENSKVCENAQCKCSCHDDKKGSANDEPFFETSENLDETGNLNESGFSSSFHEADVSREGKMCFSFEHMQRDFFPLSGHTCVVRDLSCKLIKDFCKVTEQLSINTNNAHIRSL